MQNTTQLLATHYTRLFAREKNDSPNGSRVSMVNKLLRIILGENRELKLLDVGSGPHSVERELKPRLRNKGLNFTPPSIYSLDLANINPSKLLVGKVKSQVFHIAHTRGDASKLPFAKNSFDVIYSNLAIDFAPKEAFIEVYNTLKHGGECIFHFHHPTMIPDDLNSLKDLNVKQFWSHLRENGILFESGEQIKEFFKKIGFSEIEVDIEGDVGDIWWSVILKKQAMNS